VSRLDRNVPIVNLLEMSPFCVVVFWLECALQRSPVPTGNLFSFPGHFSIPRMSAVLREMRFSTGTPHFTHGW